jgi:hypothetical protein
MKTYVCTVPFFQYFLTPEDETDKFSRNVCKALPHHAVKYPRREQVSRPKYV